MLPASSATPPRACALPWRAAVVLVGAGTACYANSLAAPFLFDDPSPGLALSYATRPLVSATFALNRVWSGFETWSYHLVNLLIHLAGGLLLLGVLRRGLAAAVPAGDVAVRGRLALAAALLWVVHPLQTAAVTYLSQRAESLASCLYLAGLYSFLRLHSSPRGLAWQGATIAALLLGFATKEIIATLPAVLLLLDACLLAPGPLAALRRRPIFYACLAAAWVGGAFVYLAPQLWAEGGTAGFRYAATSPLEYARTQPGVILHYLRLVVWPEPLCFDYGWPLARGLRAWLPQTLLIAGLLSASMVLAWRRSGAGVLGLAFFLVLAPSSSVVPIQDAAFEHRMYLALAAPLVLLVAGARRAAARCLPSARWLPPLLTAAAALACAFATVRRNGDYRDPVSLFEQNVALVPGHARAHLHLGTELLEAGRIDEAIAALHEGLRLDPRNGIGYLNLGKAYLQREEFTRALPFLARAAELVDDARIQDTLGGALFLAGRAEHALPHFEQALAANPGFAPTHQRYAEALAAVGRTDEALRSYEQALRLDPGLAGAHYQLATLLLRGGRAAQALVHADAACALAPAAPEGLFARAQVLHGLGRSREALALLRTTIALAAQLPEPHAEFAQIVARLPDASGAERAEALRHAQRASELSGGTRPELLLIQAEAEAGVGDFARARASLDRALALPALDPGLAANLRERRATYEREAPTPR